MEAGIGTECKGPEARQDVVRSRTFKEVWKKAKDADKTIMKKVLHLTKEEIKLAETPAWKLVDKMGAAKCDGHYRQLQSVIRNRETAGKIKKAKYLLTRQQYAKALDRHGQVPAATRSAAAASSSAAPPGGNKQARRVPKEYRWKCRCCDVQFKSGAAAKVKDMASRHRKQQHPLELQTEKEEAKTAKARFIKGMWRWPCNLSGSFIKGATKVKLTGARALHIRAEHEGTPMSAFRMLTGQWGRERENMHGCKRKFLQYLDRRKDMVLEDGDIESNPGPSQSRQRHICSLNVDGLQHAYEALPHLLSLRPHAFTMQEVRADAFDAKKLRETLACAGYRAWYAVGKPPPGSRAASRTHGGSLLAVRDDVRASFAACHSFPDGEFVAADLGGLCIVGLWHRPGAELDVGGLHSELAQFLQSMSLNGKSWFACGDWNSTPSENAFLESGCGIWRRC